MPGAQVAVSVYCERLGTGLWAEPFNAISNLAFLLAALLLLRRLYKSGIPPQRGIDLYLLVLLLISIAFGSLLWHTLATPWSEWADVIPIMLFISVYLLAFLVRIAGFKPLAVIACLLLYHLLNTTMQLMLPQQTLNGSIFYLPTLVSLALLAALAYRTQHPNTRTILFAIGLFCLSLLLRTLDRQLCGVWPIGTHFLWHLLNAWVLYLLSLALLPTRPE